jgi:hypothetical protein
MKRQFTFIFLMILGSAMGLYAQSPDVNDYVIVGLIPGDGNMPQIEDRYQGDPQAYFSTESSVGGVGQITAAIAGRQITDLHVFVRSDMEGLFITSVPVTSANIDTFSELLSQWKNAVSGKVWIHNVTGNSTPEFTGLLTELGGLTDLEIVLVQ